MATSLPTDIAATYTDVGDASRALHQQHHDAIHEYTNTHDEAPDPHPQYASKRDLAVYSFFGPVPKSAMALQETSTGGYIWPGDALSASTLTFNFDLGTWREIAWARWHVVWTPNDAANGIRLVHADNGPSNITELGALTGLSDLTPQVDEVILTTELNALRTAGVLKNLGHQITAGATGPVIFSSRLEILWA